VLSAKEMAAIAEHLDRKNEAQSYLTAAAEMETTVREHGWDSEWFLRAYDDYGTRSVRANVPKDRFISSRREFVLWPE